MNFNAHPLGGLRIIENALAESFKVEHRVERHPIKKRRKQWRVVRHEWREPCIYKLADGTLVMHPSIAKRLRSLPA